MAISSRVVRYCFSSAASLLANETALLPDASILRPSLNPVASPDVPDASPEDRVHASILALWHTMHSSIERAVACNIIEC